MPALGLGHVPLAARQLKDEPSPANVLQSSGRVVASTIANGTSSTAGRMRQQRLARASWVVTTLSDADFASSTLLRLVHLGFACSGCKPPQQASSVWSRPIATVERPLSPAACR